MVQYTDEAILKGIKASNNKILRFLYSKYFPSISKYIRKNSGTESDAEDIFQEGLVVIYKKLLENSLNLTSTFQNFLFGICKNKWLQVLEKRKKGSFESLENSIQNIDNVSNIDDNEMKERRFEMYRKHFVKLKDDCQRIIEMALQKISMDEIAIQMGFKGADYAKFRHYQCRKRLKENISNDPMYNSLI